jgi:BirA family biotin operon repressor/biotin-[acetyl-CoA-carboxylase] ligase
MVRLSGDLIRHKLGTHVFGQNVIYTKQTGSTNTELKKLARLGAPEGLLYFTEEQWVGRGRMERSWHAPAGSGLLMSLLFRPEDIITPAQLQALTMLCSLAIVEAIANQTNLSIYLKWPNDLVWEDGKKLAGILTEAEIEGDRLNWAIVGIGLNVNVDFSDQTEPEPDQPGKPNSGHPPLSQTATSLSMILGRDTDDLRLPILQHFLANVERRYTALKRGVSPHYEWQRHLIGLGQFVTVTVLDEVRQYEGKITGVTENGALRLRQADETMVTILAGDVTLR